MRGVFLRDNKGGLITTIVFKLGQQKCHYVEIVATYNVIKMDNKVGVQNVIIEGSYMNTINYLKGKNNPSWTIDNLIKDVIMI